MVYIPSKDTFSSKGLWREAVFPLLQQIPCCSIRQAGPWRPRRSRPPRRRRRGIRGAGGGHSGGRSGGTGRGAAGRKVEIPCRYIWIYYLSILPSWPFRVISISLERSLGSFRGCTFESPGRGKWDAYLMPWKMDRLLMFKAILYPPNN